jgi:1-acyl-sn-glycerol-3-phosphate acyltransferase
MIIAGIFAIICFALGNSIQTYFVAIAIMNALVALFIFVRVPEFIMRMGAWLLVHSLYRIGKHDLHHIPDEGAAVIAANHVSFVDPILVAAVSDRPIRFVMYYKIYRLPIIHYLFKTMGAIPIASAKEDPQLLTKAYDDIAEALENDELVCIFPEGGLTPDGEIQNFKGGISKILQRSPVPVIPMALRGLWGTWFSRAAGRAMKGVPRNWMKRIDVITGQLIQAEETELKILEENVKALRAEYK